MPVAMQKEGELLTKTEVARELGIRIWNVEQLVKKGYLKQDRTYPGVQRRFRRSDVETLRETYERQADAPMDREAATV